MGFRSRTSCPLPSPPPSRSRRIHAPYNRSRLTPWHYHRNAPFQIPHILCHLLFFCCESIICSNKIIPEREGFEPSVPFRVHTTSNRAPSAARSSLQYVSQYVRSRGDSPSGVRHPASHLQAGVFAKLASVPVCRFKPTHSLGSNRPQKPFESPLAPHSVRSRGDSNPRNPCEFNGFRNHLLQPLGHRSKEATVRSHAK